MTLIQQMAVIFCKSYLLSTIYEKQIGKNDTYKDQWCPVQDLVTENVQHTRHGKNILQYNIEKRKGLATSST